MIDKRIAIATLLVATACSQQDAATSNVAVENASAAAAPAKPAVAKTPDQAFVDSAAANDAFAQAAGNLAKAKATRPAVKEFGQRTFDEHVQSMMRLKAAAARLPGGGLVDPSLTPELLGYLDVLQKAQGAAFDTAFVTQQRQLHERAMQAMTGYAASGGNDSLKEYADYNSRRVRARLDRLREL